MFARLINPSQSNSFFVWDRDYHMVAVSVNHNRLDFMLSAHCSKKVDLLTLPPQTTELSLYAADIDDHDLRRIQHLPLQELSLQCTGVGDCGLSHVSTMHDLVSLNLTGAKITDQGLRSLSSLNQLERLTLWGARGLNEASFKCLQDFPRLRWLNLGGVKLDELALFYIGKVHSLQALEVSVCDIPEQGLRHLSGLTDLRLLRASHNFRAGGDFAELETLTRLEVLDLWLDKGAINCLTYTYL